MERIKDGIEHSRDFARWLAISLIVGGIMGAVGTAFHFALEWAAETRDSHPWMVLLLPAIFYGCVYLLRTPNQDVLENLLWAGAMAVGGIAGEFAFRSA